jgi:hypothetical protein
MAKGMSGIIHQNPFNEVDNKDPNKPDSMGDDLYFGGWDEVMKMHLAETGDLVSSPNSDASHDIFGGPASGEPNPAGMGGKGGSK